MLNCLPRTLSFARMLALCRRRGYKSCPAQKTTCSRFSKSFRAEGRGQKAAVSHPVEAPDKQHPRTLRGSAARRCVQSTSATHSCIIRVRCKMASQQNATSIGVTPRTSKFSRRLLVAWAPYTARPTTVAAPPVLQHGERARL